MTVRALQRFMRRQPASRVVALVLFCEVSAGRARQAPCISKWEGWAVGSLELLGENIRSCVWLQASAASETYDIRLGIPLVYDGASSLPDDQM